MSRSNNLISWISSRQSFSRAPSDINDVTDRVEHGSKPHYVWFVTVKCEASRTTKLCNLLEAHVNPNMTKFHVVFNSVQFKLDDAKLMYDTCQ